MRVYLYQRILALPSSVFFKQPEFDTNNFNIPAIGYVAAGLPQPYDGNSFSSCGYSGSTNQRLACTNCIASRVQTGTYWNHFQDLPAKPIPEDVLTNAKNWMRD